MINHIIDLMKLVTAILIGTYISTKFIKHEIKGEIEKIIKQYVPENAKKEIEKIMVDMKKLIKHVYIFLGVKEES